MDLLLLGTALGGQLASCLFWWDDIYTAASVAAVLGALLLPAAWRRAESVEERAPAPAAVIGEKERLPCTPGIMTVS